MSSHKHLNTNKELNLAAPSGAVFCRFQILRLGSEIPLSIKSHSSSVGTGSLPTDQVLIENEM
ncbi:uncharacterized protein METZ01_LOCUS10863 [marine metagenome]|uniref:Uncharacterized protein n=1 Tax=marine metagenome TaxID=408172 RepID=A0A381NUS3_9ZZZZ